MTLVLHSELPPLLGGVTRARAGVLAKRPDFPAPAEYTHRDVPLWDKAVVERWQRERMAKRQPRKAKAMTRHDPTLIWARPGSRHNTGGRWAHVPACWCGWYGEPTDDKSEATRKAYAHAAQAGGGGSDD